jgi:hypothetical protein
LEIYEQIAKRYTMTENFKITFKPIVHKANKDIKEIETLMGKVYKIYPKLESPEVSKDC